MSNGTSNTQTLSPRNQYLRTPRIIAHRTAGCTIALSFRRCSSFRNTMAPSLGRSSVPSSFKISGPNVDTILLSVRVPGRTTSRARTSASITGMLRAASCLETVDFPVAMPPVRPMTITWLELWVLRGQLWTYVPNISGGPPRPVPLSGMATGALSHAPSHNVPNHVGRPPTCPNAQRPQRCVNGLKEGKVTQSTQATKGQAEESYNTGMSLTITSWLITDAMHKAVTPDVSVKKDDGIQQIENVEYVSEQLDLKGAALEAFSDVFARFQFEPEDSTVRIAYQSFPSLPFLLFFLGKI